MTAKELMLELDKCPPDMEMQIQINDDDDERLYQPVSVTHNEYGSQFVVINVEEI